MAEGRRKEEQKGDAERHNIKASEKKDDKECSRIGYPYQTEEGVVSLYMICILHT